MKTQSETDKLWVFWYILKALGIRLHSRVRNKFCIKKSMLCSWCFITLSALSTLAFYFINIHNGTKRKKIFIASAFTSCGASIFMYLTILRKRVKLALLRKIINDFPVKSKFDGIFIILYGLILLSVVKILIVSVVYFHFFEYLKNFFTIPVGHKIVTNIFAILFGFLHSCLDETIPAVLVCVFCAICRQWVKIITSLKREVQCRGIKVLYDPSQADSTTCLLRKCITVWNGTKLMKDVFDSFLLFLVLKYVMSMFVLSWKVIQNNRIEYEHKDIYLHLAMNVFFFTISAYLASRIPEEMDELLKCVIGSNNEQIFRYTHLKYSSLNTRMKLIMKLTPTALSAGGFADINKSFILGTFGSLLTYGLIAVQSA